MFIHTFFLIHEFVTQFIDIAKNVEKRETLYAVSENYIGTATMENRMEVTQKTENSTTI